MEEQLSLRELFSCLALGEQVEPLLQQNRVLNVDLRVKEREVVVCVRSEAYLPLSVLIRAEQQLREYYELRRVTIEPRYDPNLLSHMDFADVTGVLSVDYPPAPAVLAGCRWEVEGSTLHAYLRGNGLADLQPHLRRAEEWLSECFESSVHLELHGGPELSAEQLFEQTKRIREEVLEHAPAPVQQPVKEQKQEAPVQEPGMIYGKPFFQEPIPMSEVNLDMFKVCVEGEVFAVNHKELTKAKAWVVNFYMTDHTGSICVNQYMEMAKAKPILDAIHGPNP